MRAGVLGIALLVAMNAHAAGSPYRLTLQLPLYDSAANKVTGFSPSLLQAQALTQDFYLGSHRLLAEVFSTEQSAIGHPFEYFALLAFDYVSQITPLGMSWLHEEAHRSVLNQYGIRSHNGVYDASLSDSSIPVDEVRDVDLIRLKREYPADFVRLSTAGMEAESQLALNLEKAQFFDRALPRQRFLILLAHLGPISYRTFCDSRSGDHATTEDLATEGPNEMSRDFSGYDCVSYVYDLFRPFEPYEARGPHPSGEGIARYRSRDDLTSTEKNYLRRMSLMGWLNLVDPFLLNFSGWTRGDRRWAATLRHHLTPFGHSLEQNIFLKDADRDEGGHLFIVRQYTNQKRTLPGIEWQCFGCQIWKDGMSLDLRTGLWWQPKSLLYASRSWKPGGFLAVQVKQALNQNTTAFAEVMSKSRGWMADEINLSPATDLRLGLTWQFN
ncbi:MAG: hypothetical protein M3Q07_05350 [Pseudobdellovibrionaceae bacterium]|nr:hypothetical protein [Pseudobdellovibrionaceae bacterium]